MNAQRVRIVVGEGRSSQQGLLRFVLVGEGYDVVADATNPAELARVLAAHKPDVVVLDDGIGATAVGMVREMAPGAKVVLVWPGAVVPIGGAAQVPPSRVLQDLGPAIARVTGVAGVTAAMTGRAMVDEAKRDPAALRRLISDAATLTAAGAVIDDSGPAPVVILPTTPAVDGDIVSVPDAGQTPGQTPGQTGDETGPGVAAAAAAAAVLTGTGVAAASAAEGGSAAVSGAPAASAAGAAAAGTSPAPFVAGAQSDLNRRLGNLALGGAAVAAAIVVALALGGAKVPIAQVSGQAYTFTPPAPPGPGDGAGGNGFPGQVDDGAGGPGGGGAPGIDAYGGTLDFYPIQPYLSAILPVDGLHEGAGGPLPPPVETAGRRGGRNQHHRAAGRNARHGGADRKHGGHHAGSRTGQGKPAS